MECSVLCNREGSRLSDVRIFQFLEVSLPTNIIHKDSALLIWTKLFLSHEAGLSENLSKTEEVQGGCCLEEEPVPKVHG
jgi:hypothetical protein